MGMKSLLLSEMLKSFVLKLVKLLLMALRVFSTVLIPHHGVKMKDYPIVREAAFVKVNVLMEFVNVMKVSLVMIVSGMMKLILKRIMEAAVKVKKKVAVLLCSHLD